MSPMRSRCDQCGEMATDVRVEAYADGGFRVLCIACCGTGFAQRGFPVRLSEDVCYRPDPHHDMPGFVGICMCNECAPPKPEKSPLAALLRRGATLDPITWTNYEQMKRISDAVRAAMEEQARNLIREADQFDFDFPYGKLVSRTRYSDALRKAAADLLGTDKED